MNNRRRKDLKLAATLMGQALALIEAAAEGEREAHDNMPEGLQSSPKGEKIDGTATSLEDMTASVQELIDTLNELTV